MKHKLILVEGLPGFGKTTTAQLVQNILQEHGMQTKLFLEGNLDHPADYDGTAFFTAAEWTAFTQQYPEVQALAQLLPQGVILPYAKLRDQLSEEARQAVFAYDIYELPLVRNQALIVDRWKQFAQAATQEECVYIFECCFLQNPLTVSMIKYGASYEESLQYVQELAQAVNELQPLLFYVNRDNLADAFKQAVAERPKEWSEGFMAYYTAQGYGQAQGLSGVDGTIEVLAERRRRELDIAAALDLPQIVLDNSPQQQAAYAEQLVEILRKQEIL